MNDKTTAVDPRLLALDTLWADLPYLMGRASAEGHEAGQALAQEWQAKIEAARKEADREEQHRRDMAIMRSCWEEAEEKVGTYQAALRQIGRILSDLNIPHLTVVDTNDGP